MSDDLIVCKDRALRRAKAALVTMQRYKDVDPVRHSHALRRVQVCVGLIVMLNTVEHAEHGTITLPRMRRDDE